MITLNNEKIKQTLYQVQKKYNKSIDLINENIENLNNFSKILEINSILKLDNNYPNDLSLLYYLKYYEELIDYFTDEEFLKKVNNENYKKTIDKRNGDADIREYGFTNDIEWIYGKSNWADIKAVGYAKRTYKNEKGEIVTDTRYYITNLDAKMIDLIAYGIRSEWKIQKKRAN